MYRDYLIMQAPGAQAKRYAARASGYARSPRPKRVAVRNATGQLEALKDFEHDRYLATGNQQYAGSRVEWRGSWRAQTWKPWNGTDDPGTKGREWRLVVTLRNGAYVHEAIFLAWPHDGRWDRKIVS